MDASGLHGSGTGRSATLDQTTSVHNGSSSTITRSDRTTVSCEVEQVDEKQPIRHKEGENTESSIEDMFGWVQQNLRTEMLEGESNSLSQAEIDEALPMIPRTLLPLLYKLVNRAQMLQSQNMELVFNLNTHRSEAERLSHERASLLNKVESAALDRQAAESLLASVRAEKTASEKRWGEEKNELNGRITRLTWKDITIRAQLKKKDVEYEKLQKQLRLGSAASNGGGTKATSGDRIKNVDITPKAQALGCSLTTHKPTLAPDEASRASLEATYQRQALLLEENAELRDTLQCLYAEVKSLQDRYGDLVEEIENCRSRQKEELAKSRGKDPVLQAPDGEEEYPVLLHRPTSTARQFHKGAFQMPAEWLGQAVGEALRADMAELGRRYERMRDMVMEPQGQDAERKEKEKEGTDALGSLTAEKRALRHELRLLRTRLQATEDLVAQQETVIKRALFEETGESRQLSAGIQSEGQARRRISDSWQMDEHAPCTDTGEQGTSEDGAGCCPEETRTLEELTEKLTADLMLFGAEFDVENTRASPVPTADLETKTRGARSSPPLTTSGKSALRTPLRALTGQDGNLLSPMLEARLDVLNRKKPEYTSAEQSLNNSGSNGYSDLRAQLGLLSPIERHSMDNGSKQSL